MHTSPLHGRIAAMDVARGFAVLFMVLVHVQMFLTPDGLNSSGLRSVVEFLGSIPAAPVFMFLMGASLAFSSHTDRGQLIRRGMLLVGTGYALNVLRIMPEAGYALARETPAMEVLPQFFDIDILHFAGLALMLFGLLRIPDRSRTTLIAAAALVALVAPLLWGIGTGHRSIDMLLAPFWGSRSNVFFPVFPWLAFPLAGLAYGKGLADTGTRSRFLARHAIAGVLLMSAGSIYILFHPEAAKYFYRQHPAMLTVSIGFVPVWLWCCNHLTHKARLNGLTTLLGTWSRGVTPFYVAHWIIIGWMTILPFEVENVPEFLLASAAVAGLSHAVMRLWVKTTR